MLFIQFFFARGISLSRFIPGEPEGYHMTLGCYLFGLLKVSQPCLEPVAGGGGGGSAGGGGLPVLSVYCGMEKPSMG
jgi:hypothetical protein